MAALQPAPQHGASLSAFLEDLARLETIFDGWDETPRRAVTTYSETLEALHGEALRRLIGALRTEPAAMAAMKQAACDELVYAVLRRHNILKPSIAERVQAALESVRPMLASHGGDVELVEIAPPAIEVRFLGACDGCPASALTFHAGVKKAVQDACPEITEIRQVKGLASHGATTDAVRFVSPFALNGTGDWRAAGKLDEIPEGGIRALVLDGEKVMLHRNGAVVSCLQNACAHLGFPLDDGIIEDGVITCPFHGFRYDLASGECLTAPAVQLLPHAVRVIGDRVEVRLSK
jgi:nitrite reductase/ring-hydroxylating ferredoxin subunit/Fe-S cluster biogenesis protein NfuA